MLIKRLILAAISLAFGGGATYLIVLAIGTLPFEYGTAYFVFTMLSIACALGIWLDKFMETDILPK